MSRKHAFNRLTSVALSNAEVKRLIPALKTAIRPRSLKLSHIDGREARMRDMSKLVTAVIRDERVEYSFTKLSETRDYIERLIAEAVRHGDQHQPTMDLADFWINDKRAVHKLFKVLVPRFQGTTFSYTKMYKAPNVYPGFPHDRAILELRNNPLLPIMPRAVPNRNWINNVLLEEARKDYELRNPSSEDAIENDEELD